MLSSIENTLVVFFERLTETLGFGGYLGIALGVELLFVLIYGIKSAFSYEARFKRAMNKANNWLFINKKLTIENIRQFTNILKKAPKRVTYFWQQYIMYREGGPTAYLTEENLIEKPLKTSSWLNNVKNLGIATIVWTIASTLLGLAAQATKVWNFSNFMVAMILPLAVALVGGVAMVMIKGFRVYNLDDVYESYHIFARFLTNACDELPPYIELDMLFTKKELSRASVQLKEFYEANARKAKEAFEEAKRNEERISEYNFTEVGVDGALLLDRAMKESENYINQKTKIQSQIAQVEAQKDAMRRNYENIQMDLQRKIQASKENIQKLIEQQAATTSRIEVGLLRQQQDKEAKKLEELQRDYDKEETRYKGDRDEHEKEIERLRQIMHESLTVAERGMTSEYQSFLEKLMKTAYTVAEKKVEKDRKDLEKQSNKNEQELISVQTQIKRLMDENITLRAKLEEYNPEFKSQATPQGHYDENGNFIYADGSYHDPEGLFHDIDGNVYNMNGERVSKDYTEEEAEQKEREDLINGQINQFGSYIDDEGNKVTPNAQVEPLQNVEEQANIEAQQTEPVQPEQTEPKKQPIVEDFVWDEQEEKTKQAPAMEEALPVEEEFVYDQPATPAAEQPVIQEPAKTASGKKRGRPRKTEVVSAPAPAAKKRGRPKKTEQTKISTNKTASTPSTTRPKPRKRVVKEEVKEEVAQPAKKRGRPRKVTLVVEQEAPVATAKKRGRPRKTEVAVDLDSVAKISQLISEEEEKLSKMKELLHSEINQVMVDEKNIESEKAKLVREFEQLKSQADNAKNGATPDELASINARLQELIKEINVLNNKN